MPPIIHEINSLINSGNLSRALLLLEQSRFVLPPLLFEQKLKEIKPNLKESVDILFFCHHTANYGANSGIQRVVRQLLVNLIISRNVRVQCVCFNSEYTELIPLNEDQKLNLSKWSGPNLSFLNQTYSDFKPSILLLPELFYRSYYETDHDLVALFSVLKTASPRVVTIFYDNIPLIVSQYLPAAKEHKEYLDLIITSDLILPISRWSACDLAEYGFYESHQSRNVLFNKIHPIPLAFTPLKPSKECNDLDIVKLKLSKHNFILSVGSIVPHKNQLSLIQAFLLFKSQSKVSYKLVLAGNCIPIWLKYLQSLEDQDIIFLLKPSDSVISYLYENCNFVVFPSKEEGYGLPIIESISYGKPVISANFGVMDEVANLIGKGVLQTDVSDIASIRNAIACLVDNPAILGDSGYIKGTANIKSWEAYTQELINIINRKNSLADVAIYLNVTFLCAHDFLSGVQRVVVGLFKGLIALGLEENIVPVVLSPSTHDFRHLNAAEYQRLSKHLSVEFSTEHNGQHFLPLQNSIFLNAEIDVIFRETPLEVSEYIHTLAKTYSLNTAIVFHDAIPYLLPKYYGEENKIRHENYIKSLVNYQYIFPNSYESSLDLSTYYNKNKLKLSSNLFTIHLAVDKPKLSNLSAEEAFENILANHNFSDSHVDIIRKMLLGSSRCILYVSSIERRKSQISVSKAYKKNYDFYSANSIPLVFVGRIMDKSYKDMLYNEINDYPFIIHFDSLIDDLLEVLYSKVLFTVYFSEKEGFGLPVVESLRRQIPVLLNYVSSMRELCNSGGVCPVYDSNVSSLTEKMLSLCTNSNILAELRRQLESYSAKSWELYVQQILGYMNFFSKDVDSLRALSSRSTSLRSMDEFYARNVNISR